MTGRTLVLGLVMLGTFSAAACDIRVNDKGVSLDVSEGGRAEDESTQNYPLAQGGQIEIEIANANVELVAAPGPAVELHTRRQANAKTDEAARELLKRQYSTIEATPQRVVLRGVKQEGLEAFRQRVRVNYRISVPKGSTVSIKNENGNIRFEGVDGHFVIGSTNGRIEGERVSGSLDLETVNGFVVVEMTSVTGDVKMRTVNGGVTLRLPETLNATLEATTVNGGVSVNDTLPLKATSKDRQRLSGTLGTGTGPRIEVHTTNGGVRLEGTRRAR